MKSASLLGCFLILFGGLGAFSSLGQRQAASERELVPGTYPHRAKLLRDQGVTGPQTILSQPSWPVYEDDYEGLAAAAQLIVLARCRSYRYRLSPDQSHIQTVFRFDVEEVLKGDIFGLRTQRFLPTVGALEPGQIAVRKNGGTIKVDDVLFTEVSVGFEPFEPGSQYVLFLKAAPDTPTKHPSELRQDVILYDTVSGPYGCIEVEVKDAVSILRPLNDNAYLTDRLQQRFSRSKDRLLEHFRRGGANQ